MHDTDITIRMTLAELERSHIEATLTSTGGNKKEAARILGIDRKTLYRKLQVYRKQDRQQR